MDKEYTMATFLRRFIISVKCLIIGSPCFYLGIVRGNTLGVMAFLATVILLIMMFGWIFDISTNLFLKILVVIGCCCGFPNAALCLSFSVQFLGGLSYLPKITVIGLLILPATILSIYLSLWYFNLFDKTQSKDKINNV